MAQKQPQSTTLGERLSAPSKETENVASEDAVHSAPSSSSVGADEEQAATTTAPSKIKQLWTKTGLDAPTLMLMFKGSLPPTIAIAAYQSPVFAAQYTTLGYLVAISSVLGFCIMPRGKFIQTMSLNILAICFAAAINLLALYSATQARLHTTPADALAGAYNSSASAVCAIWLIFFIFCINVMRALRPQLQFPAILASIFCIVSMSYGVAVPDVAGIISFEKRLLETFLTGFGLATGVSFFVFPMSSRMVVMKEMAGYLTLLNALLKLETAYMADLETVDVEELRKKKAEESATPGKKSKMGPRGKVPLTSTPIAEQLRQTLPKMFELHTKLGGDITPAKREFAIGKLESHDLTEVWKRMRTILVPIIGLSSLMNILERRAEIGGWDQEDEQLSEGQMRERKVTIESMQTVMKQLHKPFADMTAVLDGGFRHVLLTLELVKPPREKPRDEENSAAEAAPGTAGFAEMFKAKVDAYYASKDSTVREWFREQGIEVPPNFFTPEYRPGPLTPRGEERNRRQRQLFFLLYLEHLLWRVGVAVLDLITYVEKRKAEGTFEKSRLIFPGSKTMYKWFRSIVGKEDITEEDSFTADMDSGGAQSMYLGEEFLKRKDPEHLPPRNAVEKLGDAVRSIPRFLRSDASAFGLRVAAATMTIGIVNYLHDTQTWFLENRILWAEIMVAISMTRTAGQSFFNFALRVLGTVVAMVASYVIWYIVDGKTPGVIVFLWFWIFCSFYVVLKFPRFVIVAILGLVTSVLIIGYELQVRVLGLAVAESNGQPAYPLYILAPYRLAAVVAGLAVAFIWTIFPYPISEGAEVRKDLAACLYLLSNYYSIVHEVVLAWVRGTGGDVNQKGSHAYNLEKAHAKVFSKLILLLTTLRTNAAFGKFQLRVGGRFPREEYDELIQCCSRLVQWFSLIAYTSRIFDHPLDENSTQWQRDFHHLFAETQITSHEITSLLALLSSSMSHGAPLPPYVQPPPAFGLTTKLNEIDADILSIRHITEPEYSAFAVLQAVTQYISSDVAKVKKHVTTLVGEIDFTFHAVKSTSSSSVSDQSIRSDVKAGKEE